MGAEKLASAVHFEKSPGKIIGKRFIFSGPFVAFVKSDSPVRTFNPFSTVNNDITAGEQFDRYLPRVRGITLIQIGF